MNSPIKNTNYKRLFDLFTMIFFIIIALQMIYSSSDQAIQVYDSSFGQDANAGPISIDFDSTDFIVGDYTHRTSTQPSRIYVNSTGLHRVSYACTFHSKTADNRHTVETWIRLNGGSDIIPSRVLSYIRNQDADTLGSGNTSSNSATSLISFSDGDYIELRAQTNGQSGNTETDSDCSLNIIKIINPVAQVYDSSGGQTLSTTAITVNLDTSTDIDSEYSLSTDQLSVNTDGWYKVNYQICPDQASGTGGNDRNTPAGWLRLNGVTDISSTYTSSYLRTATNGDINCLTATSLVQLSNGDYIELRSNLKAEEDVGGETISLLADQNWIFIEKIETQTSQYSEQTGGQTISSTGTTTINFDTEDKISNYTSLDLSNTIIFNKSGLYEISYNLGYDDSGSSNRHITCSYLELNGITQITPSKSCDYSRGRTNSRHNSMSNTILFNATINDEIKLKATTIGSDITVEADETWIIVKKLNDTSVVKWELNSLDLGRGNVSQGNLTSQINIIALGENNSNVNVSCELGDCSTITQNWINPTDILAIKELNPITFTCNDNQVGFYNATFNVKSDQYNLGQNISVNCNITRTYGTVDITLNNPLSDSYSNVIQNETFRFNSTITCDGVIGSICGNVTITPNYNTSSSTFTYIPISPTTPTWMDTTLEKSCILNKGESCELYWDINLTGNLGQNIKFNINSSSNLSEISSSTSNNITINITIIPPGQISWSSSNLNLGSGGLNLGDLIGGVNILPGGDHPNVSVTCVNGDCLQILDNWADGDDLTDGNTTQVQFACSDLIVGNYSTIFKVNSSVDNIGSNLNISCEISQTYGNLKVNLTLPSRLSTTEVDQNSTFIINTSVECLGTSGAFCGNISTISRYSERSVDYGDGNLGIRTITSVNTIINNYTYLTSDELIDDLTITVSDASEFEVGDEILIIQSQNGSGNGEAGIYEFKKIESISSNDLTLDYGLENSYYSGLFNQQFAEVTQIIKVPRYVNLTINNGASIVSKAWDGFSGGIVVFRVNNTLNTTGYVNVSHLGYRGGSCNGCGDSTWGDQGEGYLGIGNESLSANGNGGGGGYGPSGLNGEPGGGGGYANSGGDGISSFTANGGDSIGDDKLTRIFFGGGGGAGGDDDSNSPPAQYRDGGGAALIFANNIINARIISNGEDALGAGGPAGVAGGGAGGAIWLNANNLTLIDVTANGGSSFDDGADLGGAGGDGRIRLDYNNLISGTTSPVSKYNNSNFVDTSIHTLMNMIKISTISTTTPFNTLNSQPQTCSNLVSGDICYISWIVNAIGEGYYRVDSNFTSNFAQVLSNETKDSAIKIDTTPELEVSIITPSNNSKYFNDETITVRIQSNLDLIWAAYYLNGDLGNLTNLTPISGKIWEMNITGLEKGNYNITFMYNETTLISNSTDTNNFIVLNNEHKKLNKRISSVGSNIYVINISVENLLNKSIQTDFVDFVDNSFNYGSVSPSNDYLNDTVGPNYLGKILGWNVTLTPLSITEFSYALTGVGNSYNLSNNYPIGLS